MMQRSNIIIACALTVMKTATSALAPRARALEDRSCPVRVSAVGLRTAASPEPRTVREIATDILESFIMYNEM